MKPAEFQYLADLLKRNSGIVIGQDKMYLVESRLGPLAIENGCRDLDDLVGRLRLQPKGPIADRVIEAMTTNETFFFRDKTPFTEFESHVLPELIKARADTKRLRIWCAAASSGQEPYSLAMILKENAAKLPGWRIEIVGTDLSKEILEKAKAGIYSQFEVQRGLPVNLLVKYFRQQGELWHIDPAIKSMVRLQPYNLLEPYTGLGQFDVVFCRNVLIYFDRPTKKSILERMAHLMPSDGRLFLGAAETVVGLTPVFQAVTGKRGLYEVSAGGDATLKRTGTFGT